MSSNGPSNNHCESFSWIVMEIVWPLLRSCSGMNYIQVIMPLAILKWPIEVYRCWARCWSSSCILLKSRNPKGGHYQPGHQLHLGVADGDIPLATCASYPDHTMGFFTIQIYVRKASKRYNGCCKADFGSRREKQWDLLFHEKLNKMTSLASNTSRRHNGHKDMMWSESSPRRFQISLVTKYWRYLQLRC